MSEQVSAVTFAGNKYTDAQSLRNKMESYTRTRLRVVLAQHGYHIGSSRASKRDMIEGALAASFPNDLTLHADTVVDDEAATRAAVIRLMEDVRLHDAGLSEAEVAALVSRVFDVEPPELMVRLTVVMDVPVRYFSSVVTQRAADEHINARTTGSLIENLETELPVEINVEHIETGRVEWTFDD